MTRRPADIFFMLENKGIVLQVLPLAECRILVKSPADEAPGSKTGPDRAPFPFPGGEGPCSRRWKHRGCPPRASARRGPLQPDGPRH